MDTSNYKEKKFPVASRRKQSSQRGLPSSKPTVGNFHLKVEILGLNQSTNKAALLIIYLFTTIICLVSLMNNAIRLLAQIVCQTHVSPCQQHRKAVREPFVFSKITDDGKKIPPCLTEWLRTTQHKRQPKG